MKNILSTILFFALMSTAGSAADSHRFWIAGKLLNKIYTNYDVTQYMERALLDDAQRGKLFKEAEGNFDKYKALVRQHTAVSFEAALKMLMYNKVLEHHATSGQNIKEWKAFRISPNDYHKEIQKLEDQVLKPLLDKRLGIRKSRDQFGAYLIENNFPHKRGESNTDVYFRWYNDQKFRLKHEMRGREAQRYEAIAAMGHQRELYVRPTDQNDFYKKGSTQINRDLNGKKMSQTQVSEYLRANPDLKVIIQDIHYLSLNTAPLSRILEKSESRFEEARKKGVEGLASSLTDEKIQKILSYENLANKMAKKYGDAQRLTAKSSKAMQKFLEIGEYKEIMKAKTYALAASLIELKAERNNIRGEVSVALRVAMEDLKSALATKEGFTGDKVKRLLFEDVVAHHMKESLKTNLGDKYSGYLRKVLNLGVWVLEFDAKKIAFNAKPEVAVTIREYMSFETQKKIQDHLKMKEFKALMEKFRERTLRYAMEGLFSVDFNGERELYGVEAYDWLIAD